MMMHTDTASSTSPLIYPAQSVLTLVGRAWNLCRQHWKIGMLVMAPPAFLQTAIAILASTLTSGTFLTGTSAANLLLSGLIALITILGSLLYYFAWGFSALVLSRFYFSAIIGEDALSLKDCWRSVWKRALPIGLMLMIMSILVFFMLALDGFILFFGGFISAMAIGALSVSFKAFDSNLTGIMTIFFLLLWGFVVLALILTLVVVQGFIYAFPFIAVGTAPENQQNTWQCMKQGLKQVFENLPRLLPFALVLFFFTWIVMLTLMTPALIWTILELQRLGIDQQHHIPMHISLVTNVMRGVIELLSGPFIISALTLFWYDCQVRREGLDLRLWFNHLVQRRGKSPERYKTAFDLKPV